MRSLSGTMMRISSATGAVIRRAESGVSSRNPWSTRGSNGGGRSGEGTRGYVFAWCGGRYLLELYTPSTPLPLLCERSSSSKPSWPPPSGSLDQRRIRPPKALYRPPPNRPEEVADVVVVGVAAPEELGGELLPW